MKTKKKEARTTPQEFRTSSQKTPSEEGVLMHFIIHSYILLRQVGRRQINMDFNNLLLALSVADSSGVLGILDNGSVAVIKDLPFKDEQDTINRLMNAHNYGCKRCIVTQDGTYIDSGHVLEGYD